MNVIDINGLTKYYGKHKGIEDVSFSVEEGEIFGFIGPNGAGKSTTIRTLLALIYPTKGSATIFGKDCIKYGHEIRRDIGYLPSEVFYYEHMKVLEVLKYSASFYDNVNPARIKELADIMDLDLNKRIDDLSYGNKKKVGIVQGLLHTGCHCFIFFTHSFGSAKTLSPGRHHQRRYYCGYKRHSRNASQ
ncbi:MAG: beta-exotoxin transport system ATP-binding protein [Eubacteriaceae bacterium]|nr:beta-exotoxin transport system ATP-binding protein [Eubacteriaceae bacterium]